MGSAALRAAIEEAKVNAGELDEVIMGCVLTGGMGQSPARQASLAAGIPDSVGVMTLNRVCSSGLKAVMVADQMIRAGDADVIAAGGMESMTNAPYCVPRARAGLRLGDGELVDTMVHDGLWDFHTDQHMGSCAELCVKKFKFTREAQDEFAVQSYTRAQEAISSGAFDQEVVAVGELDHDEEPGRADFGKMKKLKPAFAKDGTITAANASSISDGAAALVVASDKYAADKGLKPLARIVAHDGHSHEPEWFTTAPIGAIGKVLGKADMSPKDIDIWEINEAFSCVTMATVKELGLDMQRVNVHGGAVALGHPIGCSGSRILTTLLHTMLNLGKPRGLAALCNGGGEATAIIIELI